MLRSLAALLVLSAVVSAQIVAPPIVSVTGVIEPISSGGGGYALCAPGTHVMKCTEGIFQLVGTQIDLEPFEGQNIRVVAGQVSKSCPLFDVLEVDTTPPATLQVCGTEGLGCPLRLQSGGGGLSQHWLILGAAPSFYPVSIDEGTFLLGEPFIVVGPVFAAGIEGAVFDFNIPSDASLIGVEAFVQNARRDVGPVGPIRFGNLVCIEILGFPIICHPAVCPAIQ